MDKTHIAAEDVHLQDGLTISRESGQVGERIKRTLQMESSMFSSEQKGVDQDYSF